MVFFSFLKSLDCHATSKLTPKMDGLPCRQSTLMSMGGKYLVG